MATNRISGGSLTKPLAYLLRLCYIKSNRSLALPLRPLETSCFMLPMGRHLLARESANENRACIIRYLYGDRGALARVYLGEAYR